MTGKAGHPTGGTTAHAVFILGRSKPGRLSSPLSDSDLKKLRANLDRVSSVLIDEASMCGTVHFEELERNIRAGRKEDDPRSLLWFRVVFVGDFAQCPPIKSGAIIRIEHHWLKSLERWSTSSKCTASAKPGSSTCSRQFATAK